MLFQGCQSCHNPADDKVTFWGPERVGGLPSMTLSLFVDLFLSDRNKEKVATISQHLDKMDLPVC